MNLHIENQIGDKIRLTNMAQDLRKMMSVFINGKETLRKIDYQTLSVYPNILVNVPEMDENELLIYDVDGMAMVINKCTYVEGNGSC